MIIHSPLETNDMAVRNQVLQSSKSHSLFKKCLLTHTVFSRFKGDNLVDLPCFLSLMRKYGSLLNDFLMFPAISFDL